MDNVLSLMVSVLYQVIRCMETIKLQLRAQYCMINCIKGL